jgi:putative oxygen-independent coproporphyrinogen III oxidase
VSRCSAGGWTGRSRTSIIANVTAASAGSASSPPVGLYVHIPFCVSICPYCDFVVVAGSETRGPRNRIDAFVAALLVEIELRADALDARFGRRGRGPGRRPALGSLYLGGGTPSLLGSDALATIVERVRRRYGLAADAEVTLEANPGPDERGDPLAQRELGVTRISFGAQSFNPAELSQLGRRHAPSDIDEAVGAARSAGIGSINLDLLYDVPGQTLATWMDSLERAIALAPDHLSLYALTLDDPDAEGLTGPGGDHLPTTVGARRWRERGRPAQDEDRAAGMYHFASHHLAESRFRGYELSNWARPGHESRHNLAYWERRPVEAVGPGAHAFDGAVRRWNAARLDNYITALRPGSDRSPSLPPGADEPPLSQDAAAAESIILGLRLDAGVPLIAFLEPPFDAALAWADEFGLVEQTADGRVRLTTNGRLLSNELFARLL